MIKDKKKTARLCIILCLMGTGFWSICIGAEPVARENRTVRIEGNVVTEKPSSPDDASRGFSFVEPDPAVNVPVTLVDGRQKDRTVSTDTEGCFAFSDIPTGKKLTLKVDVKGYALYKKVLQFTPEDAGKSLELEEIWLHPACKLTVRVKSLQGGVIDNATVQAKVDDFSMPPYMVTAQKTGAGQYVFNRLSSATGNIYVKAPGHVKENVFATEDIQISLPKEKLLTVRLSKTSHIGGLVTTRQGTPIANATVYIEKGSFDFSRKETKTDADGRFKFASIKPEQYEVTVVAKGFLLEKKLLVTGFNDATFLLTRESSLAGQVLSKDNKPVSYVAIKANIRSTQPFDCERYITSFDVQGRFHLNNLKPDTYVLDVLSKPYRIMRSGPWIIKPGEQHSNLIIKLGNGCTLFGAIREASTGLGITNADIVIRSTDDIQATAFNLALKSGPEGLFHISGLKTGCYTIRVTTNGHVLCEKALEIHKDNENCLDIRLRKYGILSGNVSDASNHPVEAKLFLLTNKCQKTCWSEGGSFQFEKVPPQQNYTIAGYTESGLWGFLENIRINDGEHRKNINLQLKKGQLIRGRVIDEKGQGQAALVTLISIKTANSAIGHNLQVLANHHRTYDPSRMGRFERWVFSPGKYQLKAKRSGHTVTQTFTVKADDGNILDGFKLTFPPGGSVSGRVVDSRGQPIPEVSVRCYFPEDTCWLPPPSPMTLTDKRGLFNMKGLRPGICNIQAKMDFADNPIVTKQVSIPGKDITIVLEDSAKIVGRVSYQQLVSFPKGSISVYSRGFQESDMAGRFSIKVPSGRPFVNIDIPGFAPVAIVCSINPGETKHITVPLKRMCSIKGIVKIRETGEPVAYADAFIETQGHLYRSPSWAPSGFSDSDGTFRIQCVAEGVSSIKVFHPLGSGTSKPIKFVPNQEAKVVIEIEQGTGIFGTLSNDWCAFHGQKLLLIDDAGRVQAEASTNNGHFYQFNNIPAGQYGIIVKPPLHDIPFILKEKVTVENGQFKEAHLTFRETIYCCPSCHPSHFLTAPFR